VLAAVRDELQRVERRIPMRRADKNAALATVIATSPHFLGLLDALDRAWTHLRSLRVVANLVFDAAHGNLSSKLMGTTQRGESLQSNIVGLQYEDTLIEVWRQGLDALANDADSALPAT
jgi:hypothetical protein